MLLGWGRWACCRGFRRTPRECSSLTYWNVALHLPGLGRLIFHTLDAPEVAHIQLQALNAHPSYMLTAPQNGTSWNTPWTPYCSAKLGAAHVRLQPNRPTGCHQMANQTVPQIQFMLHQRNQPCLPRQMMPCTHYHCQTKLQHPAHAHLVLVRLLLGMHIHAKNSKWLAVWGLRWMLLAPGTQRILPVVYM